MGKRIGATRLENDYKLMKPLGKWFSDVFGG